MNHYTIYKTCKYNINKMNYEMHIIINQKKYQLQLSLKVLKIRWRWWLLLIRWWARCSNSIRWTSDEVWASSLSNLVLSSNSTKFAAVRYWGGRLDDSLAAAIHLVMRRSRCAMLRLSSPSSSSSRSEYKYLMIFRCNPQYLVWTS
jgi:hypothetical protein